MTKLILLTSILVTSLKNIANCQLQELNEFQHGKTKKFISDGKLKGKGIKFSILYPVSYKPNNVDHVAIVKAFEQNAGQAVYMVGATKAEEGISKRRKEILLSKENCETSMSKAAPAYGFLDYSENLKVDNCDAVYIEFENKLNGILCFNRHYFIIAGDYLFTVGFIIPQNETKSLIERKKLFNSYKPFFDVVISSLKFIDYGIPQSKKIDDFDISDYMKYKDRIPETDKNKSNETWDNELYRNKKYKFRVAFPKNWEYDGGTTKGTLARSYQREKGVTISVIVRHLDHTQGNDSSNIYTIPAMKQDQINKVLELQNMKVENFKSEKGYLNNFPAYLYEFTSKRSAGTESYTYLSKQIQCLQGNKIYILGINIPIENWDEEMMIHYDRVIKSFVFEIAF
jgi:hypothetical protein